MPCGRPRSSKLFNDPLRLQLTLGSLTLASIAEAISPSDALRA